MIMKNYDESFEINHSFESNEPPKMLKKRTAQFLVIYFSDQFGRPGSW